MGEDDGFFEVTVATDDNDFLQGFLAGNQHFETLEEVLDSHPQVTGVELRVAGTLHARDLERLSLTAEDRGVTLGFRETDI